MNSTIRIDCYAADCVEEVDDRSELLAPLDVTDGCLAPQEGAGRGDIGISLAILRRFWAVAARRNSSLAPFGPRRRRRSSFRMRLRCANNISTFFRCLREVT